MLLYVSLAKLTCVFKIFRDEFCLTDCEFCISQYKMQKQCLSYQVTTWSYCSSHKCTLAYIPKYVLLSSKASKQTNNPSYICFCFFKYQNSKSLARESRLESVCVFVPVIWECCSALVLRLDGDTKAGWQLCVLGQPLRLQFSSGQQRELLAVRWSVCVWECVCGLSDERRAHLCVCVFVLCCFTPSLSQNGYIYACHCGLSWLVIHEGMFKDSNVWWENRNLNT